MKLFWRVYYNFYTPKNKSEIIIKMCRLHGYKFINMKLAQAKKGSLCGLK